MDNNCEKSKWKDAYKIGDERIDNEHKKIFNLINKTVTENSSEWQVKEVLSELVRYTKYHFGNEESYMRSIYFNDFKNHIKKHKAITNNLNNLLENLNTLSQEEIRKKLQAFTSSLLTHILHEDKKIYHFMCNKKKEKIFFRWKEEYALNDSLIDEEHKKLFKIANKVFSYHQRENQKEYIKKVIVELYEYMKVHFEHEEEYMEKLGFPGFKEHQKKHSQIIEQMAEMIKRLSKTKIENFEKEIVEYIDIWLVHHILAEDIKVVCHKQEQER